jgi:biotin transport system substrate-specific component
MLLLAFNAALIASAKMNIFLPWSPVPITMQTLVVLLCGVILGARLGAAAVGAYVLEGMSGLPFFASHLPILASPTFGYLIGFIAASYLTGALAEREYDRTSSKTILLMALGNAVVYLCGCAWLAHFTGSLKATILMGVIPFIPGDAIKIAIAAALLPALHKVSGSLDRYRDSL